MTAPEKPSSNKPILRNVASVILGVIVANIIIIVTEILNTTLHPMPPGANPRVEAAMRAWIETLPASAFALVLFGWTFGSFMGGVVAGRIERTMWRRNAAIVGALVLGGAVLNMRSLPHPVWMWVGAFVGIVPAALLGGRTGATQR